MTVLVDSWAWIEFLKGTPPGEQVKGYIQGDDEIVTSSINIAEVYKFLLQTKPKEADHLIHEVLKQAFVIPISTAISLQAARIKHEKKMGMADAIVLATARAHHAKVLTGDDDFKKEDDVIYIGR